LRPTRRNGGSDGDLSTDRQRIDKWLWHARVVRTRPAAAALANGGQVRLNGERIDAASRLVRTGDVVTVALDRTVRVMRVTGFAERRGSADRTHGLYEEIGPEAHRASPVREIGTPPARDPGAGRPTKRDRRDLENWLRDDDTS
jgi:ribosome-associated heat shock protein Hsp15